MVLEYLFFHLYYKRFRVASLDERYRVLCIRFASLFFPFWYRLIRRLLPSLPAKDLNQPGRYIVSLTSFPARYEKLWLTVTSLLRQERLPDAVVLCLPQDEIASLDELPASLKRLQKCGVEIIHCSYNLLPHNKYHAVAAKYPRATIITIDDDVIYPPDLVQKLIAQHRRYPSAICCGISRTITVEEGQLSPYNQWRYVSECTGPRKDNLVMGVGGALYPSGFFSGEMLDAEQIRSHCLKADDLWLTVHAHRKGYRVACIAGDYPRTPLPVLTKNDRPLSQENISCLNDQYFTKLLHQFNIPVNQFAHAEKQ